MLETQFVFICILLLPNIAYSKKELTAKDRENARQMGIDPTELKENGNFYNAEDSNLTFDDHTSHHMPEQYRCDGCFAVAYKVRRRVEGRRGALLIIIFLLFFSFTILSNLLISVCLCNRITRMEMKL